MKTDQQTQSITIIGAGLVGSLFALLMRKRGYQVRVLEKRADPRNQNRGGEGRSINLIVTSRGFHALSLAGLEEQVKQISVKVFGREIHDQKSRTVYQPYGQKNECNYAISRSRLNEYLINQAEKAGAQILFQQQIQSIDFQEKQISLKRDGKSEIENYEILFGTDGVGSIVRSELIAKFPQVYSERKEWLGVSYKELMIPATKDGKGPIRTDALHIWPRGKFMMMALANLDHSLTVTLYLSQQGKSLNDPSFDSLKSDDQVMGFFREQFPDAVPLIEGGVSDRRIEESVLIKDFHENPHAPLGTVRLNQWVYGESVALMGDAAHGIVPFFGQGMNCGFEDCSAMMQLLDQEMSWSERLDMYQKERKINADAIADMAVENWFEMSERVADPKFLLRKKVEAVLEDRLPDIFKSRYGLVTYSLIPYAKVKKIGELQNQFFQNLLGNVVGDLDQVNLQQAELFVRQQYQKAASEILTGGI